MLKWMIHMSRFFLANQKHTVLQGCLIHERFDSYESVIFSESKAESVRDIEFQSNDSYEFLLFSESKTYRVTR